MCIILWQSACTDLQWYMWEHRQTWNSQQCQCQVNSGKRSTFAFPLTIFKHCSIVHKIKWESGWMDVHQTITYHCPQLSSCRMTWETWWRRCLLWRGQLQLVLVQSWPLQLLLCSHLPQHPDQLLPGSPLRRMTDSELPPMDDACSSGEGRDVKLSGEPSYAWQGETQCAPSGLDLPW